MAWAERPAIGATAVTFVEVAPEIWVETCAGTDTDTIYYYSLYWSRLRAFRAADCWIEGIYTEIFPLVYTYGV